jgi:hypothetical protein
MEVQEPANSSPFEPVHLKWRRGKISLLSLPFDLFITIKGQDGVADCHDIHERLIRGLIGLQ